MGEVGGGSGAEVVSRLTRPLPARWTLTLYPRAGEAGGCFVPAARAHWTGVRGAAADPERARREAGRRRRARLRRYCASNGLNRLGTLTYGPPFCRDPREVRTHVGEFFRELRSGLGGDPMPYAWVPELHKDRERFHVHLAVGRYVPRNLIERAWGHGFVHIKLLGDLPVGSSRWDEARAAARYLSKYVTKTFDDPAGSIPGLHAYDVAQGFQPRAERIEANSRTELLDAAVEAMDGAEPVRFWFSDDAEDWQGPPALWVAW
jgi:hypothetical protein